MPKNSYYYFDHEACTFVEVQPRRRDIAKKLAGLATATLVLTAVALWGWSTTVGTPSERTLQAQNQQLSAQFETLASQTEALSSQLEELAEVDQELYRTILGAEPISEDVRQAGAGGAYPVDLKGLDKNTAKLVRDVTSRVDELSRRLKLQGNSYGELMRLAVESKVKLAQTPAIIPTSGRLTSGYGSRRHPILRKRKMHNGIDISARKGEPIYASADGVINLAGRSQGYGLNVRISHPESGFLTLYAHMSQIAENVRPGVQVKRGELIGYVGSTGLSTSDHLHYEVRDLRTNEAHDPLRFFANLSAEEFNRLKLQAEQDGDMLDYFDHE